ncbi:hypothetical protein XENTR_v10012489 [Xenopus tropicalis]|uniref:Family with sequence similarity 83 member F n=1 Tax=Xenopus tropicalis TaxID=8364 RepID=A0A6I8QNA4_XENTR|nr:protein FAM83F [Xenopus tropicalis]KAE8611514.1 hypothetical protein XENTR_v10012489 [Xenopus tropicalis]KAE8611515.1 hypothetical protein XENTR_v10012489 [Xenopus tropicalis]KAE8611516.1 hypothetical protein XENTR_v10012489 [Xenopus tropicalis]KAE8611517.1 hypothetical protein XENTR_v10012489 [Xenopus tropicalis]
MADSQVECLQDDHVNRKVTEDMCQFYYSEEHRRCLEVLSQHGIQSYREYIKELNIRGFLSTKELIDLKNSWKKYDTEPKSPKKAKPKSNKLDLEPKEEKVSLQYWPDKSDTEIPPLDLGWPENGFYRGVSQMLVYTHPPKENAPTIKAVIRDLIQTAKKVIAIVMDYFTDREIFKDVLDAADKRRVPVYMILGEEGVKHFLEMCEMMQLSSFMLRNVRVRYVTGVGVYLPYGKISGCLTHKYLMVDGDKVASGSFRFTWSSLRVDRSIMTLLSGNHTEPFDIEFRELYTISEEVNLYKELSLSNYQSSPMIGARARSSTVARKLINPKYSLVVGRSPAPGEMLRFGTPNPPAEGEDGKSEGEKRMDKFLDDLISIEQESPEIVNLDDLPQSLPIKKETRKFVEDSLSPKPSKKVSKFFSLKKRPQLDRVVDGDFVVVNKPTPESSNSRGHSNIDLRSSVNSSPTKSEKPKTAEKCIIS